MKMYLFFLGFLFLQCQSQNALHSAAQVQKIMFEDRTHYSFSLTARDFLIIDSQEKWTAYLPLFIRKATESGCLPFLQLFQGKPIL
ncbi:hypothetical protein [uncultured Chryseobacterium sp.]|uniref:hypothetical protein n=1 Tax=uncultured Chryseobacterium sp. TaxID=259322 RepID=UPI0025E31DF7|nr:hypothetical protein [uncultured Chryseobacterium sp.]